jgi:hypothetical protein
VWSVAYFRLDVVAAACETGRPVVYMASEDWVNCVSVHNQHLHSL